MSGLHELPGAGAAGSTDREGGVWIDIGQEAAVIKQKKVVVTADDGTSIVVVAHEGRFHAMDNICIHRQRELARGVVLNGRLVCPGHQWSFDLSSGWEAVKQECQPTYAVRVTDGVVQVDTASRTVLTEAPE